MKKERPLDLEIIFMDNAGHKLEKVIQCGEFTPQIKMVLEYQLHQENY